VFSLNTHPTVWGLGEVFSDGGGFYRPIEAVADAKGLGGAPGLGWGVANRSNCFQVNNPLAGTKAIANDEKTSEGGTRQHK